MGRNLIERMRQFCGQGNADGQDKKNFSKQVDGGAKSDVYCKASLLTDLPSGGARQEAEDADERLQMWRATKRSDLWSGKSDAKKLSKNPGLF